MKRYKILFLFTFLLFPPFFVSADLAPLPMIEFQVENIPEGKEIIKVELLNCDENKQCENGNTTAKDGITWGTSDLGSVDCNVRENKIFCIAFDFGYYLQLSINLSGENLESDFFRSHDSELFKVIIQEDGLKVVKGVINSGAYVTSESEIYKSNPIILFIPALLITVFVEVLIAIIYLFIKKHFSQSQDSLSSEHLVRWVIYANIISLPILWLGRTFINVDFNIYVIVGEILVFLFEFLFITAFLKRKDLWVEILLLVLVMNLATFYIGTFFKEILFFL